MEARLAGDGRNVDAPNLGGKPLGADASRSARATLAALTLQLRAAEREAEAAEQRLLEPDPAKRLAALEQSLGAWVGARRLQFERETDLAQTAAAQRVLARRAAEQRRPVQAPPVEAAELVTRSMSDLLRSRSVLPPRPGRATGLPPVDRPLSAGPLYTPTPPRRPSTFETSLPPRPTARTAPPSRPADALWPPRPSEYTPPPMPTPAPPRPQAPPVAATPPPQPSSEPVEELEDDPVEVWLRAVSPKRARPVAPKPGPEPEPAPEVVEPPLRRPAWGTAPASEPVAPGPAVAEGLAVVVPPSGFGYQLVRLDGAPIPAFGGGMPGYGQPYGQSIPMAPYVEPREKLGFQGFLRRAAHPDVAMPLVAAFLVLVLLLAWLA